MDHSLPTCLPLPLADKSDEPGSAETEVIQLFDASRASLHRYALSFGLSPHDGEDVVQEVFLSLFRHLRLGRSRHNLRGWIFRVAHNLSLKRRSTNQRRFQHLDMHNDSRGSAVDPSPSVEEQLVWNESRSRLLAVFEALPEQDQRCLRLRAEGLRYREIAGILGISLGSVSISLTRSLARFERADRG